MDTLFIGFHFGAITIIILFNFLWYLSRKETAYLYYIALHISMLLLFLDRTEILVTSDIYTVAFAVIFSVFFAKEFLNVKKYYPKINSFSNYFIGFYFLFVLVIDFFDAYETIFTKIPYVLFFAPYIVLGYLIYKKGYKISLYFVVGWAIFTACSFISYIIINFYDSQQYTLYILLVGNLMEAIILSFALAAKNKIIHEEKEAHEKMLIHQSRLASMGEMLANISHQWRQPLSRVSAMIMNMQLHLFDHYPKERYLPEKLEDAQEQIEYMSQTIDDFIHFYQKDKKRETFLASTSVNSAINIVKSSVASYEITIEKEFINDFELHAYPKELSQVLLNIIHNAKDQFVISKTTEPLLKITLDKNTIILEDNAGGIQKNVIERVFEPYFTTKGNLKGTGLGLYMAKNILEKNFDATITAQNTQEGARFTILFEAIK